MESDLTLCPSQVQAVDGIRTALPLGSVFELWTWTGRGRTTMLKRLQQETGGHLLTMADFVDRLKAQHPLSIEESLFQILMDHLQQHDVVLIDDLHLVTSVFEGCSGYPRAGLFRTHAATLAAYTQHAGKKLILGTEGSMPEELSCRAIQRGIGEFTAADYAHLMRNFAADAVSSLDFEKIHRFAPRLNVHQLQNASLWFGRQHDFETESFIEYLRDQHLASNVNVEEVSDVTLADLCGVDEIVESLEANIVLPLENDDLATRLDLKPKRGVLLAGPPGTGKTTVGRALARRLKGKFFLIDGTCISGTDRFYGTVHYIFEAAKNNAPSVIFIDDSDVIFESGREHGLYRYLLTMLDGLESKSAGRVCVMLTAMDVGNIPPALVRSGRIELWLEMKLPDLSARTGIIQPMFEKLKEEFADVDIPAIASDTEGFTGADLKRLVEDGKTAYAFDLLNDRVQTPLTGYFLRASEAIRENKQKYAEAEKRTRRQRPTRPTWFSPSSNYQVGSRSNGDDDEEA